MNNYMIIIPILIPILAGLFMLFLPFKDDRKRNIYVGSIVVINTILTLYILYNASDSGLFLFELGERLPITLKIDGLSRFFGTLVSCLWPLATLYAFEYMRHEERVNTFLAFYTITYGVTLGVAFAGNIVAMYLFYEALTMVTLPLVMHEMTDEAKRATRKYLYYMIGGTGFAFIGMVLYVMFSMNIEFVYGGNLNVAAFGRYRDVIYLIYLFTFFGFGVKAAIFPFHGWLPEASVAPTPVTALLHAVAVVKSGVFAIMRFTYYCMGAENLTGSWAQKIVCIFTMVTIVYASTMSVREAHFKRRIAYSTVSNLSYVLMALSMMSPLGFFAGLCHMCIHAVMKISAFFCVGAVKHQTGKNYVYELDGLGRRMPMTFAAFLISAFSLSGLPLFAGFISKWKIAEALFGNGTKLAAAGVIVLIYSALMTAIYMLSIFVRAFFVDRNREPFLPPDAKSQDLSNGVAKTDIRQHLVRYKHVFIEEEIFRIENAKYSDPSWHMLLPLICFSIIVIIVGFYPDPLLRLLGQIAFNQSI